MIVGIGTDLLEIRRVEEACKKESFYRLCYTEQEKKLCGNSPAMLAGNFAVKEAVSKVFGTGFRKVALTEIEVLRDGLGKPYVNLSGAAASLAKELGISRLYVSISDTKELVLAMAVGEGGNDEISSGKRSDAEDGSLQHPADRHSVAGADGAGGDGGV